LEVILKPEDANQLYFTCRADTVADEPLVRCVDDVVGRLDLAPLYSRYSEGGAAFYDPAMQLRVLFFAYCDGVRSCREIEQRIRYDLRYQYYTGSLRPDFRTINRFRQRHLDLLPEYFVQIMRWCQDAGLLDGTVLAIDGTKVRASCSGRRTWSKEREAELADRVGALLQEDVSREADDTDSSSGGSGLRVTDPDARFMRTSDGVVRSCYNAQVAVDKHQLIVAADVSTHAEDSKQYISMVEQAAGQFDYPLDQVLVDRGYYSGRALQHAERNGYDLYLPIPSHPRAPDPQFERSAFDYDATTDCYRCPAGQLLTYRQSRRRNGITTRVYRAATSSCRDCQFKARCTKKPCRELNISEVFRLETKMRDKLASGWGRYRQARRKHLVEPVFGNIKFNLGYQRFLLRTLPKVRGEFLLMCLAHNLKKLSSLSGWRTPVSKAASVHLSRIRSRLSSLINHFMRLLSTLFQPSGTVLQMID
jgi:transposase